MTYLRVIPRDLFNEANLLKCYAQLYLQLERLNLPHVRFEFLDEGAAVPFDVRQDPDDGSITVRNIQLTVRRPLQLYGEQPDLRRPLNSREPWPLYLQNRFEEEIAVFNDDGTLTSEMLDFLKG